MTSRRKFIAGNWKMNTLRESAAQLAHKLVSMVGAIHDVEMAVFPPFPYLLLVHEGIAGSQVRLGAQDVYHESVGAFTGEISAAMLADCGCRYVLCGHSERRHVLGESDDTVNRKLSATLAAGLAPILCVGELLAEREKERTYDVLAGQLRHCLVGVRPEQLRDVTIAYEPVWAIGTGRVATPEQAEEAHAFIRETLTKMYGNDLSQGATILYGGSVKAENAAGLLQKPNVDGLLVGGASLKADEFAHIVLSAVEVAGAAR